MAANKLDIDDKTYQILLETFETELREGCQVLIDTLLQLESSEGNNYTENLQTLFRTAHNIKGAAKSVSLTTISTIAHQLEDQFSVWKSDKNRLTKSQIDASLQQADQLLEAFYALTKHERTQSILKVPIDRIERANTKADEFITYKLRFENWLKSINQVQRVLSQDRRVHVDLNNQLIKMVHESRQLFGDFSRAVNELQIHLREMRLISIDTILSPLKRTVRELSNELKKNAVLSISGGDIEMDKAILDLIKDPLQHLLRNAIDHGIESPDVRKKDNKPVQGNICIAVTQDAGYINIEISDDGCGLDPKKIRAKVLQKGLLKSDQIDNLSDTEIFKLILLSGFSTAENLSEISGRGVGMSVVTNNLEKMKGKLAIDSKIGQGTTFTLSVPLTLATARGLLVRINQQVFMLPSLLLDGLYDVSLSQLRLVDSDTVFTIQGQTIPVRFLSNLLQLPSDDLFKTNEFQGILLSGEYGSFLLLVDSIENEQDCVVKPMPNPFDRMPIYLGMTLTGANSLVPVLNTKILSLLAQTYENDFSAIDSTAEISTSVVKKVLVVDDSLTTRSLAANALRAEGFEVITQNDGLIAWELLQEEQIDCVVTDIKMPIMDGFTLTEKIKSTDKLKYIPVIIVTSCESDDEKRRGVTVGADAYLVKSKFNTRSLIDIIKSVL